VPNKPQNNQITPPPPLPGLSVISLRNVNRLILLGTAPAPGVFCAFRPHLAVSHPRARPTHRAGAKPKNLCSMKGWHVPIISQEPAINHQTSSYSPLSPSCRRGLESEPRGRFHGRWRAPMPCAGSAFPSSLPPSPLSPPQTPLSSAPSPAHPSLLAAAALGCRPLPSSRPVASSSRQERCPIPLMPADTPKAPKQCSFARSYDPALDRTSQETTKHMPRASAHESPQQHSNE